MRNSYKYNRNQMLYDSKAGILHIDAVFCYISLALTAAAIACSTLYYIDPMFFLIFAALTGLAGFILSLAAIIDAGLCGRTRRVLTGLLGNLISVASLVMDVLIFMVFVLHIIPDFLMGFVK